MFGLSPPAQPILGHNQGITPKRIVKLGQTVPAASEAQPMVEPRAVTGRGRLETVSPTCATRCASTWAELEKSELSAG